MQRHLLFRPDRLVRFLGLTISIAGLFSTSAWAATPKAATCNTQANAGFTPQSECPAPPHSRHTKRHRRAAAPEDENLFVAKAPAAQSGVAAKKKKH